MEDFFKAAMLGIVQGLTEFLPISSSAHLILVPWLFGWKTSGLTFDVALHLGTSAAILAYFWRDWVDLALEMMRGIRERSLFGNPQRRLGWFLIVGTLPAMVAGLLLEDYIRKHSAISFDPGCDAGWHSACCFITPTARATRAVRWTSSTGGIVFGSG